MLAAMGGSEVTRHVLGNTEYYDNNIDRAMKHYMIAARAGLDESLEAVSEGIKPAT